MATSLDLPNCFKQSFQANHEFLKASFDKNTGSWNSSSSFYTWNKIQEAPYSPVERHKERSGVKIHTKISRNLCNWSLIIKGTNLLCKAICFKRGDCVFPSLGRVYYCFKSRDCRSVLMEPPAHEKHLCFGKPNSGHPDRCGTGCLNHLKWSSLQEWLLQLASASKRRKIWKLQVWTCLSTVPRGARPVFMLDVVFCTES